jgi:hypothetical protein
VEPTELPIAEAVDNRVLGSVTAAAIVPLHDPVQAVYHTHQVKLKFPLTGIVTTNSR